MSPSIRTGDHFSQVGSGEILRRVGICASQRVKDLSMAVPSCSVDMADGACDDRTGLSVEGSERSFGGALMNRVSQVVEEVRVCADSGQRVADEGCG